MCRNGTDFKCKSPAEIRETISKVIIAGITILGLGQYYLYEFDVQYDKYQGAGRLIRVGSVLLRLFASLPKVIEHLHLEAARHLERLPLALNFQ